MRLACSTAQLSDGTPASQNQHATRRSGLVSGRSCKGPASDWGSAHWQRLFRRSRDRGPNIRLDAAREDPHIGIPNLRADINRVIVSSQNDRGSRCTRRQQVARTNWLARQRAPAG
jgi:hypothetical protein